MTQEPRSLYPETAIDALARWDANEPVFTVELRGLGPSHEQCIHVLVFELIRALGGDPLPSEGTLIREWGDDVSYRVSKELGGLTGAQVGAATSFAYTVLKTGWRTALESVELDRHIIQVSRAWPRLPDPAPPYTVPAQPPSSATTAGA